MKFDLQMVKNILKCLTGILLLSLEYDGQIAFKRLKKSIKDFEIPQHPQPMSSIFEFSKKEK